MHFVLYDGKAAFRIRPSDAALRQARRSALDRPTDRAGKRSIGCRQTPNLICHRSFPRFPSINFRFVNVNVEEASAEMAKLNSLSLLF